MKLANIVSTDKINVSKDFNVVKTMDEIILGLPTLVIGYQYCKKNYQNFNITEKKLGPDLYWTFRRTEIRDKHEEDLEWFITNTYQELINKVNYIFVDPIQYPKRKMMKILRKIYSLTDVVTYLDGEMAYIYGENLVFGIDLSLLRYMGLDSNKIKDKIIQKSSVFLTGDKILIEYKKNVGRIGEQIRFLPFIYSISNGQNNSTSLIHIPRKS